MPATSTRHQDSSHHDTSNKLFFRLFQAVNIIHRTGTQALKQFDISTQQWSVLGALSREGCEQGMTVNELSGYLLVSRQNLTGVLGRMERGGYIARQVNPRDQRSRHITLTARGGEVWQSIQPAIADFYEASLLEIDEGQQLQTIALLDDLIGNMKRP